MAQLSTENFHGPATKNTIALSARGSSPSGHLLRAVPKVDQLFTSSPMILKPVGYRMNTVLQEPSDCRDEWKKARRREQCRINQARYRERRRLQEAQADSEASQKTTFKPRSNFMAVKDPNMTVDEWKKVRRREQCRMYQAEFWKRRRLLEERLTSEIEEINQNIEQLEKQKALFGPRQQRMKLVQTFYRSLQAGTWQQELLDVQNYRLTYGCTPALQTLSDLQREEFDSMESLKLHWLWYHSQFRQFDLSIATYECLVAGEHVIVEAIGSLRLGVECEDKIQVIVCPVLQQFEFEIGKAIVKRITSEVNLVNFVCGEEQPSPERILNTLSYLSQGFCSSN